MVDDLESMTKEELAAYISANSSAQPEQAPVPEATPAPEPQAQVVQQQVAPAEEPDLSLLTKEQLADYILKHQQGAESLDSEINPYVAKGLAAAPISATNTGFLDSTYESVVGSDKGWLSRIGGVLSIPSNFVTRQAINGLQNFGVIPEADVRKLLGQDNSSPSDVLNYYFKNPEGMLEKGVRFGTGLALDIILDPLSLIAAPLSTASKVAEIAGATYKGLGKLSKAERYTMKGLEEVSKVIQEGKILDLEKYPNLVEKSLNNLKDVASGKISFQDFVKGGSLDAKTGEIVFKGAAFSTEEAAKVNKAFVEGSKAKTFFGELASGDRQLTIGLRVPFTDTALELPLLIDKGAVSVANSSFVKRAGEVLDALPGTYDIAKSMGQATRNVIPEKLTAWVAAQLPDSPKVEFLDDIGHYINTIWSNTSDVFHNAAKRVFWGQGNLTKYNVAKFEKTWTPEFKAMFEGLDDVGKQQLINDITQEIETVTTRNPKELLEKFKQPAWKIKQIVTNIGENGKLPQQAAEQKARWQRLPKAAQEFVDEARQHLEQIRLEFEKRPGLMFTELNPFGNNVNFAKGYLKHVMNADFIDHMGGVESAVEYTRNIQAANMGKNLSLAGRESRETISFLNAKSLEEVGIKAYVDNPIELIKKSLFDADTAIRRYDLLAASQRSAVKFKTAQEAAQVMKNSNQRWIKFNPEHFQSTLIKVHPNEKNLQAMFEAADEMSMRFVPGEQSLYGNYVPDFYKNGHIYFPEDVYSSLVTTVGTPKTLNLPGAISSALNFANRVFINNALFGIAYQSKNFLSNLLAYTTSMSPRGLFSASEGAMAMAGKKASFNFAATGEIAAEELYNHGLRLGVLESSGTTAIGEEAMADIMASSYKQRQGLIEQGLEKIGNIFDIAHLWKTNRWLAKESDNVFKYSAFIDRLHQGYSLEGAAEAVERAFPNFSNQGAGGRAISKLFPFSSFPRKQFESVVAQMQTGNLSRLTVPLHVNDLLQGAYVPEPEIRQSLRQSLPEYAAFGLDTLPGPLLPGMRQVNLEIPWAQASLSFMLNPEQNLHPALALLGMAVTQKDEFNYNDPAREIQEEWWQKMFDNAPNLLPFWIKEPLTAYAIETQSPALRAFTKNYAPPEPLGNDAAFKRQNMIEFGNYMAKTNKNWLYDLIFNNEHSRKIDPEDPSEEDEIVTAERGEYIRKHFRDLSFGTIGISKHDTNFLINRSALTRQITKVKGELIRQMMDAGHHIDEDKMTSEQVLEEQAKTNPKAANLLAMYKHRGVLDTWFNWQLQMDEESKKIPDFSFTDLLFGNYKYSKEDMPVQIGDSPEDEMPLDYFKELKNAKQEVNADFLDSQSKDFVKEQDAYDNPQVPAENPDN